MGFGAALDEKEFQRQLSLADFFESACLKKKKKKSDLNSKLVLGDGILGTVLLSLKP